MKMTQAYQSGYNSGLKHGNSIPGINQDALKVLYADNLRKAIKYSKDFNLPPYSRDYWQGYLDAALPENPISKPSGNDLVSEFLSRQS